MEDEVVIAAIALSLTLYGAMTALHHLRERLGSVAHHTNRGTYMRELNRAMELRQRGNPRQRL